MHVTLPGRQALRLLIIWFTSALLILACVAAPSVSEPNAEENDEHALALPMLTPVQLSNGEKLRVITTLNLIGDVVQQVGGDHIELSTLLPVGADPHGYAATPADLRTIANAHVIFMIGGGLEESLATVLTNPESQATLVSVNTGLELLALAEEEAGGDPHTWTSVRNVQHWVENIEHVLSALDPANAPAYQAAAATYHGELTQLETEITAAVAAIPAEQRKLVTDHEVFGYFAAHYGFTVIGSVVPGLSTLAAPSAQALAALQDQIQTEGVKTIFVGNTVSPGLIEQLANDLNIQVVPLFTESLSATDGPAATYLDFMRYNVRAIVAALK